NDFTAPLVASRFTGVNQGEGESRGSAVEPQGAVAGKIGQWSRAAVAPHVVQANRLTHRRQLREFLHCAEVHRADGFQTVIRLPDRKRQQASKIAALTCTKKSTSRTGPLLRRPPTKCAAIAMP